MSSLQLVVFLRTNKERVLTMRACSNIPGKYRHFRSGRKVFFLKRVVSGEGFVFFYSNFYPDQPCINIFYLDVSCEASTQCKRFPLPKIQHSGQYTESTAARWLKSLGFKHSRVQRGICIDRHKRPDVVASRTEFINYIYTEILPYILHCKSLWWKLI